MKIVTLPTKSIAWLRQGLLFLGLVAAYAILFQLCYAWMYTGSPVPDADFGSFFQSILLNYIPMLVIAFSVWLVATRTLHMKSVVAKCLTDLLGSLPVAILLNWLFLLVTGLRVNWGGTAFNFVMIFVFIEFVIYSKRAREVELQEERHQRELLQKRYEVMMAQVNPHFLFNSLNILYSMVKMGSDKSCDFILSLSGMYRYIVSQQGSQSVLLSEEMAFLDDYVSVLRMRYSQQLSVEVKNTADATSKRIVPYTMQLLIENVTKHNVISSHQHIGILIEIGPEDIRVSNPVIPRPATTSSYFGLTYLTRLYQSFGKDFRVENDGRTFTAIIPYL